LGDAGIYPKIVDKENMKLFRPLVVLLLVFCFHSEVKAQATVTFSRDSIKFLGEIDKYLGGVDKKRTKTFMEQFEPVWYSGKMTLKQRNYVYDLVDAMVRKRMRPFPDIETYLYSVMSFVKADLPNESFEAWQASLEKIIEGRNKKKFVDYIKICSGLFAENTLLKTQVVQWQANNGDYKFEYENVPKIIFPSLNLRCYASKDSSVIYNTKGVFYPLSQTWKGEGGKLTWQRAGFDENETFAEIKTYQISMKSTGFKTDSALFYNKYFDQPLLGEVTEKVLPVAKGQIPNYPRFVSYDQRLFIKDLVQDVDYDGGFTMQGGNLQGSGSNEELALLTFYRKGEPFLVCKSTAFTINPENITAERTKTTIYLEDDSITHPRVALKFINADKSLTLVRPREGFGQSPYFNTYHNIDMYFEALYWNMRDPFIEMGSLFGSTDKSASFESKNYFRQSRYDNLQGMDDKHILYEIMKFAKRLDTLEFPAAELATYVRKTVPQLTPTLMKLSNLGLIIYDLNKESVTVQDRLFEYIEARAGRRDYDAIRFDSEVTEGQNAMLNLLSYDLSIQGVDLVTLSDTQFVKVAPDSSKVSLHKNRNFTFGGVVYAGRTEYFGHDFNFEYDKFKINLLQVDSMRLRVLADYKGKKVQVRLRSVIEGVRGEVLIDNPQNKSGVDTSFNEYPILHCRKKTHVFYDKPSIQKGVYSRENFYFELEPFSMDSLDNFTNIDMRFDGTLYSAGIFPEFKEQIYLQDDYSLGFIRQTPTDGFGLYGENAEFNKEIRLSHKGLQGKGKIDFLTSTSKSKAFTFFPDSITGVAHTFDNIEQKGSVEIPKVKGEDVFIKYIPKGKILFATALENPIKFFEKADDKEKEEATLKGTLSLTPKGMTGKGQMNFGNGELTARKFSYKLRNIESDTAEFRLTTYDLGNLAFKTDNINADVNFDDRTGLFKSNGEESFVEFPDNQYICYMDQFKWYMDEDDIELQKGRDLDISGGVNLETPNFYSINPKQDSLRFMAPKARYRLKTRTITCTEIDYITVADAQIYPDSGTVVIRKKAKMETLKNARILANTITQYHNIYNASVDIKARRDYIAEGDYTYIDENKGEQIIHYAKITVDTTFETNAKGKIFETDGFTLSPHYRYEGDVELRAAQKGLYFTGAVQINHTCAKLPKYFMKFAAQIDPDNIYIPVSAELKSDDNKDINVGIVMNPDTIGLYSTFISKKQNKKHTDIISANGFLYYNKKTKRYEISNKEKLNERSLPGNYVSLNTESCSVDGDGKINFGCDVGQVKLSPVGTINHDLIGDKISLHTSMSVAFPFNENALEKMAEKMNDFPDLLPIEFRKTPYEKTLRELVGLKESEVVMTELNLNGVVPNRKFPDQLATSLFIADINFKWNEETKSYQSYGPIGLANVLKKQVFKYVNGFIELKKERVGGGKEKGVSKDVLNIYLELDGNNWYYFYYKNGLFETLSSDDEFNNVVSETKVDKTKYKGQKGEADFQFIMAPSSVKKKRFVDRMKGS
jgi:hypothetical protein